MKVVKEFPVEKGLYSPRRNWGDTFDGQIRMFVQGEDYDCTSRSFALAARSAGKLRGVNVQVMIVDKNGKRVPQDRANSKGTTVFLQAKSKESSPA